MEHRERAKDREMERFELPKRCDCFLFSTSSLSPTLFHSLSRSRARALARSSALARSLPRSSLLSFVLCELASRDAAAGFSEAENLSAGIIFVFTLSPATLSPQLIGNSSRSFFLSPSLSGFFFSSFLLNAETPPTLLQLFSGGKTKSKFPF